VAVLPGASREALAEAVCGALAHWISRPDWLPFLYVWLLHVQPHSNTVWPSGQRLAAATQQHLRSRGQSIRGYSVTNAKRARTYFRDKLQIARLISDVAERLRGPGEHDWIDAGGKKQGNGPVSHDDLSAAGGLVHPEFIVAFQALIASFSSEEIAAAQAAGRTRFHSHVRSTIAARRVNLPPAEPPRDTDEKLGDPFDEDSHEAAAQKRQAQARELRGADVEEAERRHRRRSFSSSPVHASVNPPGPPPSGASDQVPAYPKRPGETTPPASSSENPAGLLITPHGGGSPLCSVNDTKSAGGDRPEPPPTADAASGVDGPKMAHINIREGDRAGQGGKPAAKQANRTTDEATKVMRRHPLFRELRKLRHPITRESFGPGLETLWREFGKERLAEVNGYRLWLQQQTGEKYGPGWFTRTVQQWAGPTGGYAEHLQRQRARRLVEAEEADEGGNAQARQVVTTPGRKAAEKRATDALDAELSRIEREEPERWEALRSLAMSRMARGIRSHPERPAFAAVVWATARAVLRGEIAEPPVVRHSNGASSPEDAQMRSAHPRGP
jgi:hypothetical protein